MSENKKYTILIIEDHPLISEAYKHAFNIIREEDENVFFEIDEAEDCDTAYDKIKECVDKGKSIDIVFLDIMLKRSKDGKFLSGEDIGLKINKVMPKTKIIVSTFLNDNYRIHSIVKSINPDGFIIKNDVTSKELHKIINTVIYDPPYYSRSVVELLRKNISSKLLLDDIDRKILYELSIGSKMKELPKVIPLSKAGIEKRKRTLYATFNVKENNDRELLSKAKESGFI